MKKITFLLTIFIAATATFAQNTDKSQFREYEPGYYQNSILKDVQAVEQKLTPPKTEKRFVMVHSDKAIPNKVNLYKREWANDPISQGNTGTCWDFATTSFLESEVFRLHQKKVKLSEIHTVYWEYVERAKAFVRLRGKSRFTEGSEANAVLRQWKKYGVVPMAEYTGKINGRQHHSHEQMFNEMWAYLQAVKQNQAWNEAVVIETIKNIMNHHIGTPPTKFTVDGKEYTPLTYLNDYIKINTDDYINILSYKQYPYWTKCTYDVPDNWWHSSDYYNVPLDDFMKIVKESVRKEYTFAIGGDVSEAGLNRETQAAMVPDFDIPSAYINDDARHFRYANQTTTDDHLMHIVGYLEKDGKDWYLVKDSSAGARNNDPNAPEFGYYFFHEDYIKLKILTFTIHKDAVKGILKKFK